MSKYRNQAAEILEHLAELSTKKAKLDYLEYLCYKLEQDAPWWETVDLDEEYQIEATKCESQRSKWTTRS